MSPDASDDDAPRVFISYSHDSDAHSERVRALSARLRSEGVDARLDQYVLGSPPEGWPRWMREEIQAARFVLVVYTETYARRARLQEEPRRGLGATWEAGLVTQLIYEQQGRNTKFVPVVFDDADLAHVLPDLNQATHYNVSRELEYRALHDYLTGQHRAPMPPLGPRPRRAASGAAASAGLGAGPSPAGDRATPPPPAPPRAGAGGSPGSESAAGTAVAPDAFAGREPLVLRFADGHVAAFGAERIEAGRTLVLDLVALSPEGGARLQSFHRSLGQPAYAAYQVTPMVAVAYGAPPVVHATHARVQEVAQTITAGVTRWRLTLESQPAPGGLLDDVTVNGYTPDDVAELRARRLLLDERASERRPGDPRPPIRPNEAFLDSMVDGAVSGSSGAGRDGGLPPVEGSPLVTLRAGWTGDAAAFLLAARLTASLWLVLTRTVEQVRRLDLAFADPDALLVEFEGVRRAAYYDKPAPVIRVSGLCHLGRPVGR